MAKHAIQAYPLTRGTLVEHLRTFAAFGQPSIESRFKAASHAIPVFTNEFWTARQRQGHPLHEISYRACFKPQLPRFFIERLTRPGDAVYDPFMGRGTTPLEAALLDRLPIGCDINPLSRILLEPRLYPPQLEAVKQRLQAIDFSADAEAPADLLVFYHPHTLAAIAALRAYLLDRAGSGLLDDTDRWIRMVATNRLTGHSSGFLSVYSLPPNQAVSVASQKRINERRKQTPPARDVPAILLKKSCQLLKKLSAWDHARLQRNGGQARLMTASADHTPGIADNSIDLVVTSPPFLNVVQYATDNWLRCWFNGMDPKAIDIWMLAKPEAWSTAMEGVFRELYRILKPGAWIAFEVGEVLKKSLNMEEIVIPVAARTGLRTVAVLINAQAFTKTANCWGIHNNQTGTNTNRIVLLQKDRRAKAADKPATAMH